MPRSRGSRVLRGLAAATIATFVALLSHIAGGGAMPGIVGVVVPWVLATLVCIALAGRTTSLLRLSIAVAVSQVLFHALFVLGAGTVAEGVTVPHHHGALALAFEPSGIQYGDVGMWAAHILAGVSTVTILHRGEHTVSALIRLGAELGDAFRRGILALTFVSTPGRLDTGHVRAVVRVRRPLGWDASSLARRGPPVLSVI